MRELTFKEYLQLIIDYFERTGELTASSEFASLPAHIRTAIAMITNKGRKIKGDLSFINELRDAYKGSTILAYTKNDTRVARSHNYTSEDIDTIKNFISLVETGAMNKVNILDYKVHKDLPLTRIANQMNAIHKKGKYNEEKVYAIIEMFRTLEREGGMITISNRMKRQIIGSSKAIQLFNILVSNGVFKLINKAVKGIFSNRYKTTNLILDEGWDIPEEDYKTIYVSEIYFAKLYTSGFKRFSKTSKERIEELQEEGFDNAVEVENLINYNYQKFSKQETRDAIDDGEFVNELDKFRSLLTFYRNQIDKFDGTKDFDKYDSKVNYGAPREEATLNFYDEKTGMFDFSRIRNEA